MELASGHSSGAWDFEMSARCVENFCIPVTRLRLLRLRYWIEVAQDDVKSRNLLQAAVIRLTCVYFVGSLLKWNGSSYVQREPRTLS
jgi:hypothetical protein